MDKRKVKNIAVFASGRGSNFAAIVKAVKAGEIKANLALLVCDNSKAGVLKLAQQAGVKSVLAKSEEEISRHLEQNKIDLIILAGFMRILSPDFVRRHKNRILNIHPSLLPAFKGAHAIRDAFDYGVKVTGVTVHFVDEKMDHGPVILQEPAKVSASDTLQSLEAKIHKIEHKLYPQAIRSYLEGKLKIRGRRVK